MKKPILTFLLFFGLILWAIWPIGATVTNLTYDTGGAIKSITFEWVSNAPGDASKTTSALTGKLLTLISSPKVGAGPTTYFYIQILNPNGIDILDRAGIIIPGTMPTIIHGATSVPFVNEPLIFSVTGGGRIRSGSAFFFYSEPK